MSGKINERLQKLIEFYDEDASDPFIIYALAIEYLKVDPTKSQQYFEELLDSHPDYVGTYYHAAKYFASKGNNDRATEVFDKGLEICRKMKDQHAHRELQNAYNEFLFEIED